MRSGLKAARRFALLAVGLVLTSGLVGCFGNSASCEQQSKLAAALATDPVFDHTAIAAQSSETYTNTPCEENSGGSLVTAGKRYALKQALTFEGLEDLSGQAADKARWQPIARIRPADPGSGGNAHVCFQSVGQERTRYLAFHAYGPDAANGGTAEPPRLFVEVSEADEEVEMCPAPG